MRGVTKAPTTWHRVDGRAACAVGSISGLRPSLQRYAPLNKIIAPRADSIVSVKGTVKAQLRPQGSVGPQSANVGGGDQGSAERRRVTVHCTRIAIVQVVSPEARDRPAADKQVLRFDDAKPSFDDWQPQK
jgi:hypothetical protein